MNEIEAIKSLQNIIEYWTYKPEEVEAAKIAISALKKQIPKKVIGISLTYDGRVANCPCCNGFVRENSDKPNICECTQRLEW